MDWSKLGKILKSARDDDAAVMSRRDALAGLGLAGLFLAAGPKLLAPAEAKTIDAPAPDAETIPKAEATEPVAERDTADASDTTDITELTSHRRRRYWRRRYWRRRYWRRRYWRRRHWRRRYWY